MFIQVYNIQTNKGVKSLTFENENKIICMERNIEHSHFIHIHHHSVLHYYPLSGESIPQKYTRMAFQRLTNREEKNNNMSRISQNRNDGINFRRIKD